MTKKIYIKDIDTLEYKEFDSLVECTEFVGLKSTIRGADVKRNIVVKNKYITAFNISEIKDYKRPEKAPRKKYPYKRKGKQKKEVFVHDLISNKVVREYDELKNIAEKYDIDFVYFRNLIYNKTIYQNKMAFSYSKKDKFAIKKPKEKVKNKIKIPNFVVFDLNKNTRTHYNDYLRNIADLYNISHAYFYEMLNKQIIYKNYLAVARTEKEYDELKNKLMKQKKFKKTNAQLKRKKVDLAVNGEFTYREPNKPTVRLGKLGKQGIINRFR